MSEPTKTFIYCCQPKGLVAIQNSQNVKNAFVDFFPYFKNSGIKQVYYIHNIISDGSTSKCWGCSLAVFTNELGFDEPQFLTVGFAKDDLFNLTKFILLPSLLFEPTERYILIFYDFLNGKEIEEITWKWRETFVH